MKYFVIIFVIAGFLASPFAVSESFAQCVVNEDWPQAPCLDVIMNGCYDSDDSKMWMNYYDYKGESLVESKKIEMLNAIEENRLQEWESQSHENSNVWQYYHLKGEIPGISGAYYLCADQMETGKSFTIQMNQSVFFDGYEITFSEILEDSRCPADVLCVWEGRVSIGIEVKNKEEIQNVILTSADKMTTYFDSYKINLVNVLPYPFSSKTISPDEYSVTIAISKIDEKIRPPLKQMELGIQYSDIQCNEGLELVTKTTNGHPACVKSQTIPKLVERGWAVNKSESIAHGIDFTNTITSNNRFALDFYSLVKDNDQNIFFSPWSMSTAFAIVNEGAKGNTATEIQDVFRLENSSKEQFKEINDILNREKPGYTIKVVNSLWLAQNFALHSDYADTVQSYYDGVIEKVDFADDGTDVINGWISEKTHQKIPKLFDPPLDPNTRLVIANAIYFNGTWSLPFDEKNTRDDKFIISPGKDVTVPFMNKDSHYNHTTTDQLQIVELSYEGNNASMLILLPERRDGMESLEKQLTVENLEKWRSEMTKSRLFLQIPKFTLETEYNLVQDLMVLGITDAFGPADFSGISSESLFIDRAVHKAFVDVNEKGTEAAAATGIVMLESMPPTFRADHPFVFVILDNETGNILFLGKVVNPLE